MITTSSIFEYKTYPKWIKEHLVFKNIPGVRKIFSNIGLTDFEEQIQIDNNAEIISCSKALLTMMAFHFNQKNYTNIADAINFNIDKCIVKSDKGTVSLYLPINICDDNNNIIFKKGAGLIKLYNSYIKDPVLENTWQFKNFSSRNIPALITRIKFSSESPEGIWDIATMSMRGISSCQTWDQGAGQSIRIIGSMIDPCTAIIYISSQEGSSSQFGSKMIRRCIVRYVIDWYNKKPLILLEKMYPAHDESTKNMFKDILRKKIKTDIDIVYIDEIINTNKMGYLFIPSAFELYTYLIPSEYPYCDSKLIYQKRSELVELTHNIYNIANDFTDCAIKNNEEILSKLFKKAFNSRTFAKTNIQSYGIDSITLIKSLKQGKEITPKICKCTKQNCDKVHQIITLNQKLKKEPLSAEKLGYEFARHVIDNKLSNDPLKYLKEHTDKCNEFFQEKLQPKASKEFAKFIPNALVSYFSKIGKI